MLEGIGDALLSVRKRDNALKKFRRDVRSNVLSALEGVALHWSTTTHEKRDSSSSSSSASSSSSSASSSSSSSSSTSNSTDDDNPDFKSPDTNCYEGALNVMHMILNMLDPQFDAEIEEVIKVCVPSKMDAFKEHKFSNIFHLRSDYPERYTTVLSFVSRRSGFDSIMADGMLFPENQMMDLISNLATTAKTQIQEVGEKTGVTDKINDKIEEVKKEANEEVKDKVTETIKKESKKSFFGGIFGRKA